MSLGWQIFGYAVAGLFLAGIVYYLNWRRLEKKHPFNGYTTAEEAINDMDLNGKTAIVTGCNTGIGKETARVLTKQGCNVIMACRSQKKAEAARKDILDDLGLASDYEKLSIMSLDLSSLDSVKSFANEYNSKNLKIDYLINNAGISSLPKYKTTADGFEMQFGVNHLGHFYLTNLLLPSLLLKPNNTRPRVINLSSIGERMTTRDIEYASDMFDVGLKELKFFPDSFINDYADTEVYALSKSCNILFGKELVKRIGKDKIVSTSLQPGAIADTELTRYLDTSLNGIMKLLGYSWKYGLFAPSFFLAEYKSLGQGAATTIRCVSLDENEISNGSFYHNCRERDDIVQGIAAQDKNGELAAKLWQLSEKLLESKGHSI